MSNTDSTNKRSYSSDWNLMVALQHELNHLPLDKKHDNIKPAVEEYLRDRIKEIKDRWK